MPTGIPGSGKGHGKGGYNILTKDDLRSRIKEIEARIKQMDRREKALGDLKKWLANRKLETTDLLWMIRQMKPKRADQPVRSKKPLQPVQKTGAGYLMVNGKLVPSKGDPEFRRRILEARRTKGWNAFEVGKKLGVSHATITSWEAGRYVPKEEMRVKVLKLYDLPPSLGAAATKAMEASLVTRQRSNNGATA